MSERKTRYNELLGVPNHIKDPDLYQLLGVERETYDPGQLEELYRERMGALQKIRSPKHKSFIEFLKGELRRARTTLGNTGKRQEYDQELFEERREQLQLILEVVLANNVLTPAEEERIFVAGGDVGLSAAETQQIVEEELAKRGALRGVGSDQAAPPLPAAPAGPPPLQASPQAQTLPQTQAPAPQPATDGPAPLGVLQALGLGGAPPAPAPGYQQPGAPGPSYLPPPGQALPPLAPAGGGFVPPPLAPSIHAPQGGMPGLAPSIHDQPPGGMPGLAPSIQQQGGWGQTAQPLVVGVCTGCMSPVHDHEVKDRKAEQFPDGRLHCPACVTRLVAGLMCAVCYGAVTRAETKQKQVVIAMIKAQKQKRAIHTRCLPQGARPKAQPQRPAQPRATQGSGGWGAAQASPSGRQPAQAPATAKPPAKAKPEASAKKKFKAPAPRKKRWHKD